MRIVEEQKIQDCFDGSLEFLFVFDSAIDENFIKNFSNLGLLEYFSDFPKPFFRVRTDAGMQIKGVLGETTFRVIFPRAGGEVERQRLVKFISGTLNDQ